MNRTPSLRIPLAFLAMLLMAGLVAAPALAQRGNFNPEQMRERLTAQVGETVAELELEGDKAEAVTAILMARVEKRFEMIGQGGRGGRGAMREAMAQMDLETEEGLAAVLTAEELARWKELEASRRGPGRRGGTR